MASRSSLAPRAPYLILAFIALLALAATARATTTITLRAETESAHTASAPVTLPDIAEITGATVDGLDTLVIAADATKLPRDARSRDCASLDIARVRAALKAANVNLGKITLRAPHGVTCRIRLAAAPAKPAEPPAPARKDREFEIVAQPTPAASHAASTPGAAPEESVRSIIARRLATHLGVGTDQLKVAFDPGAQAVLDLPGATSGSRRVHVELAASGRSARFPIRVFIYEGERILVGRTIDAEVRVLRAVTLATAPIRRGEALTSVNSATEPRWVLPEEASTENLAGGGFTAARKINPGEVITPALLESPLACKRGDVVWVHCLSGAVVVKAKTKAMANARDGEVVTLKMDNTDTTFQARMSGPGRAVMLVGAE